ncbi:MAG: SPOR domain-containing protein [Pseudomonadota bacterium]
MLNPLWRIGWVGGVFVLFGMVVSTAFERAPAPGQPLPVVRPASTDFKEVVALPPIDATVPSSSVLNLRAEPDDPESTRAAARLEEALEDRAAEDEAAAMLEAALDAIAPGEPIPGAAPEPSTAETETPAAESTPSPPVAALPEPRPQPETAAVRIDGQRFRIQLAAVKPGEEMATYSRLEQRFPLVLAGLSPRFQAISTASGVLVRVQAGPIESQSEAEARCRSVRDAGGECFVVALPG